MKLAVRTTKRKLVGPSFSSIRGYADEVRDMYEREECWPVGKRCSESEAAERVIVNPIYNYQTIKRLVVDFDAVQRAVAGVDVKSE